MSGESILVVTLGIGCGGTLYAYFGFPALAALLALTRRAQPVHPEPHRVAVTVIVSAFNEERSLEAKLRNVLSTDYPRSLLDVVVVSDASTDRTDDIARAFAAEGVRLIVQGTRRGKSAGLNRAMEVARGDIVVFTDANAIYTSDTIPTLVGRLARHDVGLVTGHTRYLTDDGEVGRATNLYTSLERVIKVAESRWGCCVGADGAVFAMRRSLYRPLRDDDINDFVMPLQVVEQGYQCVYVEDAWCAERPGASVESERRRQARITNRALRALWRHVHLLNPIRFGLFSFFLFSHKWVRFAVPVLLIVSGVSLALLARPSGASLVAGACGLAALAWAARSQRLPAAFSRWPWLARVLRLVGIVLTVNLAVLEGWWSFLRGRSDVVWQHDRSGA